MKTYYYTLVQTKTGRPFLKVEKSIDGRFILDTRESLWDFAKNRIYSPMPAEEVAHVLALDTEYKLKGIFSVAHGTIHSVSVSPREMLIRALLCGAVSIVIMHNHPSGCCTMSDYDLKFYDRMRIACSYVGIGLSDFVVVGEKVAFKNDDGTVTF